MLEEASRGLMRSASRLAFMPVFALACFVALQFSSGCGGGSGGSGGNPPPPPSNPVPDISAFSPNSANAGGSGFTLTVTGFNFISSSTVYWNTTGLPTTFISSTELQAQVSATDIATPGSALLSVGTPVPGGGNSGAADFVINGGLNPTPNLSSFSPPSVPAGSGPFILTLNGSNFVPSSTIQWNGAAISTNYLSDTQLEAQIPAASVAISGFVTIAVVNPAPGGGASTPSTLEVTFTATVVNQLANDLVWDATHQLIYLSVPSLASANGNSVATLNPLTGTIQSSEFAGSEPDLLAISDDDQYLYVGLDGSSSVQRYTLPGLVPDINYSLGAVPIFGPVVAMALQAAPGLPHTTAVARGEYTAYASVGGVAVYDDATQRPTIADPGYPYDSLQWGSDTVIYANNGESTGFDLYVLDVSSSGVVKAEDYPNEFTEFDISIHYNSGTGLVYGDDGSVVNPINGNHIYSFPASGLMIPDSTLSSAFFLGQTISQLGTQDFAIEAFDLTTYEPVAEIVVPSVQGTPLHFIRWGANGLAFNDDAGYVYILDSPFTSPDGNRIVSPQANMKPVRKITATPKLLQLLKATASRHSSANSFRARPRQSDSALVSYPSAPTAIALNPNTVVAGIDGFTLTVNGNNFVSLSTVEWNGNPVPTEFVSSNEIQAQISATEVANAGTISVTVTTPSPGGGTSGVLPFTIISEPYNPLPSLVGLNPNQVIAGSAGFTMDVNGLAFFIPSSIVEWNGNPVPSTLYTTGQLQVQVPASMVATPGYNQVQVVNPGPGGGTSNAVSFFTFYQSTVVPLLANDIVWDPVNQVIYVSVPSTASSHANQVCVVNPATAAIGNCVAAGNEPDVLAISDDSQFLYVGQDGTGTVQRFILPNLTPDISYSLGNYFNGAPYYALDLQVAPGAPHTTAVSNGVDLDPPDVGGVTIYDDATPRSTSASGGYFGSIQWGSDATVLYAADYDFYTLSVSSSGVTLSEDYPGVFWSGGRIHYDNTNGLVYSDDGYHIVDPTTGLPVAIFMSGGSPMVPDSTLGTAFFVTQFLGEGYGCMLETFDMTNYLPVNKIPFTTLSYQLNRLIRWGANGLALNDTSGDLYLLSGSFVSSTDKSRSRTKAESTRKR